MAYVYLLSTYQEYGAENVTATLDRARLDAIMRENWPSGSFEIPSQKLEKWLAEASATMAKLLQKPDAELVSESGHNLQDGWGGMQLHVVELK